MNLRITSFGKTDVGLVRSSNEDSIRIDDELNLFMVCDGMGGHQAGEVASKEACEIIQYSFSNLADEISQDSILSIPATFPVMGDLLVKSIRIANRSIYIKSRSRSDYSGMGTTIVAGVLQDDIINIAHVGDSRAYLYSGDSLTPLTVDHSWVAELEQTGQYTSQEVAMMANKNVITRALGIHETVEIDYRARKIRSGDIYIFCSDGLCGYASDEDLFMVIRECGNDIEQIANSLIQLANDRGGVDNVSVVAIRIDHVDDRPGTNEVSPVTVPVEGDEAVLRENQIVESISKLREEMKYTPPAVEEKSRKGLFIVITIILLIVIYILYRLYLQ
ncbi:MAG: Stp1/IreP family PP2C-type Ser/Thr phosphatase [Candidatus Zixiibacteriota bacterium]